MKPNLSPWPVGDPIPLCCIGACAECDGSGQIPSVPDVPAKHNVEEFSSHYVRTEYGGYYLCTDCVMAGHMGADVSAPFPNAKRHVVTDTVGCECEHADHARGGSGPSRGRRAGGRY